MPTTQLWGLNSMGRVFTLSTKEEDWKELRYGGMEFKRVSASPLYTWAIGGDHLVYVYVPPRDIPIRYKEVTFENERWNPYSGFTSKLLPTDRPHWSSEDGLVALPKESFQLPSSSWQWEDDWYIEDSLDGQPLRIEGWTYSVDFPLHFGTSKKWNSMVRRRKWVRYRRFVAMDSWTLVPSIHVDPVVESFLDISIGGNDIPGGDTDTFAVWAVTVMGRVMFRQGVTTVSPEGKRWIHVPTPSGSEVNQVSVGPTGLVWTISWDGNALVRTGVNRENIIGTDWKQVINPNECYPLQQVAVGTNAVWAVSRDGKVWFRKSVKGQQAGANSNFATGNGWVEMVGEMCIVSIGPNDQVWGLGYDDKIIYFRTGVTQAELSGKTWKPILLPLSHTLSTADVFSSDNSDNTSRSSSSSKQDSDNEKSMSTTAEIVSELTRRKDITSSSALSSSPHTISIAPKTLSVNFSSISVPSVQKSQSDSTETADDNNIKRLPTLSRRSSNQSSASSDASDTIIDFVRSVSSMDDSLEEVKDIEQNEIEISEQTENKTETNPIQADDSALKSKDSTAADRSSMCSIESSSNISLESASSRKLSYMDDYPSAVWSSSMMDDNYASMVYETANENFSWTWISSSGCVIDPQDLPQWFHVGTMTYNYALDEPWRQNAILQFQQRYEKEVKNFKSYPLAVEKSTWVKTGTCLLWIDTHPSHWIDCQLELERQGAERVLDSGILICHYWLGEEKKIVINLIEVTCLMNASDRQKQAVVLHTAEHTKLQSPVRLAFRSDKEMEDWFATLCTASYDLWDVRGKPENTAMWSTTVRGDIYTHNLGPNLDSIAPNTMMWRLLGGGHLNKVETCSAGVVWGIGYNNTAWVYTGGYGGGIYKGMSGCSSNIHPISDMRYMYVYENQRWNPLTGFSQRGLPTDRYMWSDKSGHFECTKENTYLPSIHWQWISDWAIDFRTPGGVDSLGWQYATDFPYSYHASKAFTDYVRRRRWYRKCKLNTTGPWQELGLTPLIDLSLQVDHSGNPNDPVAAWAIATNGDVLCRMGVTSTCVKGIKWVHIPADQPFRSISVGGSYRIWAVGKDGSAFFRNGVSSLNPIGELWFHVEAPQYPLHQISVGKTSVFAVDVNNNLWYRQEIVPMFPEGTSWKLVCSHIRMVSVGPGDQVWTISDSTSSSGVIYQREGITKTNKIGTEWQRGVGDGWQYISIRGIPAKMEDAAAVTFKGTKGRSSVRESVL